MKTVTPTELRSNIYKILDEINSSGISVEINKGGKRHKIEQVEKVDKLSNLERPPNFINGDPDDIVNINWEKEINLDLHYEHAKW